MATYKVIQDIEAEDKLIGPLTLRQSIYAGIAAVLGYLSFVLLSKGLSVLLLITLPPMLFTGFFAFPWGRDQSTEIWALAKIRFYLKSRKRLWSQTGVKDLVTITVPKKEIKHYSNGLSVNEVQSRLNTLASTLDSRGWAVKNVYTIPPLVAQQASDRLVDVADMPQPVVTGDITDADDIMDTASNPSAHRLEAMVSAASSSHKQQLLDHMQHGDMPAPTMTGGQDQAANWFATNPISLPQPAGTAGVPIDTSEAAISEALHRRHEMDAATEHLKTIEPLDASSTKTPTTPAAQPAPTPAPAMTAPLNPATMHLSQRDDLTISTISRIAKGDDEVVISLH